MNVRWMLLSAAAVVLAFVPLSCETPGLRVASKTFTESVILGELAAQLVRDAGAPALHQQELGGTRLIFDALAAGEVDVYPEYTGTILHEIFAGRDLPDEDALRAALAEQGVAMTAPLGFNNSYAVGMTKETAARLEIATISDLRRYPDLRLRLSTEFMNRADGWPSLREHYRLPQRDVRGVDHDIAYRQLDQGAADAIDVYTTDAKIRYYDLIVLEDDRRFFPPYDAVYLYRVDLAERAPGAVESLRRLEGTLRQSDMVALNGQADLLRVAESQVAAEFLHERFGTSLAVPRQTAAGRVVRHTLEHLDMVRKSLLAAILVAVPLGIAAARRPMFGQGVLAAVGIVQTIPALALLVMLMGPVHALGLQTVGGGSATAVIALFLYSLLPIVRNTYTGLREIPPAIRDSAAALGLSPWARLRLVELPIASRTILAGIKTAAVLNVGFATLGALIGAGGYGQPILTGIRLNDQGLILQGAVPAALLALVVQGLFELLERAVVSKGLRVPAGAGDAP